MRYTPDLLSYSMEIMTEVWLPVVGYEDRYHVSKIGNIKALERTEVMDWINGAERIWPEKILKHSVKDNGYHFVTLYDGTGRKNWKRKYVHRLVAEAFHGPIQDGYVVNHIDRNIFNNNADNPEIISQRDNCLHGLSKRKKSSKYPGVHLERKTGKWKAMARIQGKKLYLGKFESEDEAYKVYKSFVESLEKTALHHLN